MSASAPTPAAAQFVLIVGYVVAVLVAIAATVVFLLWLASKVGGFVILLYLLGVIPGAGIVGTLVFFPFWAVAWLLGARGDDMPSGLD